MGWFSLKMNRKRVRAGKTFSGPVFDTRSLSGKIYLRLLRFSFSSPAISDSGVISPVHQLIHHNPQEDPGDHIQHRVLLQEYRSQDDGSHEDKGSAADQAVLPKHGVVGHGPMRCYGIKYVQAREDIGGRVCLVQELDRKSEDIVPRESIWPQQVPVRIYGRDDQKQSHTSAKKNAVLVEIPPVSEKQVYKYCGYIREPQKIGDDKILHEGNHIVQPDMYDMIGQIRPAFQPHEPGHVKEPIEQNESVPVFLE